MTSEIEITNEQINDIPLLLGILSDMQIQEIVDQCVKVHGAWQGLSMGTLVVIWLSYMLTEQDHRMVMVRQWVNARQEMFEKLLGVELRETDCSDDRLAQVLTQLGNEEIQQHLDQVLGKKWIQAYALPCETVRFDTTSISVYHDKVEDESLLQFGHSKDHRPDLRQFKVMLSTLDPLGMPLSCQVLSGKRADDGLYIPAYDAMMQTLPRRDVLLVGDSKMGSLATRAHMVAGGSYYLCAYNPVGKHTPMSQWIEQALQRKDNWQQLESVNDKTGETQVLAVCDEWEQALSYDTQTDEPIVWTERVLVTRSTAMQQGLIRQRQRLIDKTCQRLAVFQDPPKQGRKFYRTQHDLQQKVDAILDQHHLHDLLQVELTTEVLPDGTQRWIIDGFVINWQAWQTFTEHLGWRVYVTNTTSQHYEALALLWVYRQQVIPERGFSRLKTRHLNIRPLYIRDEQRIQGLTWLLSLALRVLTLTEFRLRSALIQSEQHLIGLNPASPSQTTQNPTTERVLQAFQNITSTSIQQLDQRQSYVTSLNPMQQLVLTLLDLPHDLYARLTTHLPEPIFYLRE